MTPPNGFWRRLALGLGGLVLTVTLAWTASVSEDQEEMEKSIEVAEENIRNIHHEQKIDRNILNRIDSNTGGPGDAPPVRELRQKER